MRNWLSKIALLLAFVIIVPFSYQLSEASITRGLTRDVVRAVVRDMFDTVGDVVWSGYLLNALGFNTGSTAQTLTAPDPVLALDWDGLLTDFGGAVNASGDSVAPPPGSRLVTTVADGAVLGEEIVVNGDFSDGTIGWTAYTSTLDVVGGELEVDIEGTNGGVGQALVAVTGKTYTVNYIVRKGTYSGTQLNVVSGSGIPSQTITVAENNQPFSFTFTATGTLPLLRWSRTTADTGTVYFNVISTKEVLPTVLDTDTSSNPLHPSVTTGGVTDYVFYPTHEVSTAYASDKFVWAEASDGSTRYYSSSGGTSGGSAPTFPTSGTVVDNDITWTYEGRYGLLGQRVEGAATNVFLQSRDPSIANWRKNGTVTVTQNITGADGAANSGWSVGGLATAGTDSLEQRVILLTTGTRYEPSFILQQISTSGILLVRQSLLAVTSGEWRIDVSKLPSTHWETVDRNHESVTIIHEFTTSGGTTISLDISDQAGSGTLSVGYYNSQLEFGEFSTSQIETTTSTVTRSAVNLTVPTSETGLTAAEGAGRMIVTPLASGQTGYVFANAASHLDNLEVVIFPTNITMHKELNSVTHDVVKSYTHIVGQQFVVDWSYDTINGMALNGFTLGEAHGASATDTNTEAVVLTTDGYIGSRLGAVHFNATYDSVKFYPNASAAAADLDDWSLNSIWGYDMDGFGRLVPADADVIYGQAYAEAA